MLLLVQGPAPTLESCETEAKEKEKTKWSKSFSDFLALCLQKDSKKRGNAKDLLKHKWLKKRKEHCYQWCHEHEHVHEQIHIH